MLVLGKTGQVATELKSHKYVIDFGRDKADLYIPEIRVAVKRRDNLGAVINAAAFNVVDKVESEKKLAKAISGDAPGVMASVCADLDIPIIHISADYVFDGLGATPWSVRDIPNPQNAYGRSKR